MASSKEVSLLSQEKATHSWYMMNFRTRKCKAFLQHSCKDAKPFLCFDFHHENQRRRVPAINPSSGTWNYSIVDLCQEYDAKTGVCPNGDRCKRLHKVFGNTERLYHVCFYKTQYCVFPLDSTGHCYRHGAHCAFAHGSDDLRTPGYNDELLPALTHEHALSKDSAMGSVKTPNIPATEQPGCDLRGPKGPTYSKKPSVNYDWSFPITILSHFKTMRCDEACTGTLCPNYHSQLDRRRSLDVFIYRSVPCRTVRIGSAWKFPSNCPNGDRCLFSHNRHEQKFHPEVYKSIVCLDYAASKPCLMREFCPFAHGKAEITRVDLIRWIFLSTGLASSTDQKPPGTCIASLSKDSWPSLSVVDCDGALKKTTSTNMDCILTDFPEPPKLPAPGASGPNYTDSLAACSPKISEDEIDSRIASLQKMSNEKAVFPSLQVTNGAAADLWVDVQDVHLLIASDKTILESEKNRRLQVLERACRKNRQVPLSLYLDFTAESDLQSSPSREWTSHSSSSGCNNISKNETKQVFYDMIRALRTERLGNLDISDLLQIKRLMFRNLGVVDKIIEEKFFGR